ncbi:metal ABC transporter substrate-binding protein, partial [Pseudonocardia sp. ICBG1293]|uniref:metal ABC transporter substrate-binding protein n=1 Tax=Pseudonocardia sp. ICBG1293 TaxID=2844382 RepID=UPI001CCE47BD
ATVGEAQLVLMNGGGYDAFMTDLVAASGNQAPLVDAVEVSGIEGAQEAAADDHGHDHAAEGATEPAAGADHEHEHGSFNEHVWYDPAAVGRVADQLADQLGRIDPGAADYFRTNAETLRGGVAQLTSKATERPRAPGSPGRGDRAGARLPAGGRRDRERDPAGVLLRVEEGTDPPAAVVAQTLGCSPRSRRSTRWSSTARRPRRPPTRSATPPRRPASRWWRCRRRCPRAPPTGCSG